MSTRRRSYFYPRPLRGGRREGCLHPAEHDRISIHALCEEGDRAAIKQVKIPYQFLSTPSARRATRADLECFSHRQFLSTPSARRATHSDIRASVAAIFLSTPSARRATISGTFDDYSIPISIHALCEEGDLLEVLHILHW